MIYFSSILYFLWSLLTTFIIFNLDVTAIMFYINHKEITKKTATMNSFNIVFLYIKRE